MPLTQLPQSEPVEVKVPVVLTALVENNKGRWPLHLAFEEASVFFILFLKVSALVSGWLLRGTAALELCGSTNKTQTAYRVGAPQQWVCAPIISQPKMPVLAGTGPKLTVSRIRTGWCIVSMVYSEYGV
jgi:hypothetical protein